METSIWIKALFRIFSGHFAMSAIWPPVVRKNGGALRGKGLLEVNGVHRGHSAVDDGALVELWRKLMAK